MDLTDANDNDISKYLELPKVSPVNRLPDNWHEELLSHPDGDISECSILKSAETGEKRVYYYTSPLSPSKALTLKAQGQSPFSSFPYPLPWNITHYPEKSTFDEAHKEIRDFIYTHGDLIDEKYYTIVTSWAIVTWFKPIFDAVPYLFFIGPPASGKTRLLEMLEALSYRGIISVSVTPAALFRLVNSWQTTNLIDEAQGQLDRNTESGQANYMILNSGYKRSGKAIRCEGENNEPRIYNTFSFNALAARRHLYFDLEQRCIKIPMVKAARPLPKKIDYEWAEKIRAKLLYLRLCNLETIVPVDEPKLRDRVAEIFEPILTFTPKNLSDDIIQHALEQQSADEEYEKHSREAHIVEAINFVLEHDTEPSLVSITHYIQQQHPEDFEDFDGKIFTVQKYAQKLSYTLRDWGIKTEAGTNNYRELLTDKKFHKIFDTLKARYKIEMPKKSTGREIIDIG